MPNGENWQSDVLRDLRGASGQPESQPHPQGAPDRKSVV